LVVLKSLILPPYVFLMLMYWLC